MKIFRNFLFTYLLHLHLNFFFNSHASHYKIQNAPSNFFIKQEATFKSINESVSIKKFGFETLNFLSMDFIVNIYHINTRINAYFNVKIK